MRRQETIANIRYSKIENVGPVSGRYELATPVGIAVIAHL
jgi:hypothetical protein